MDINKAASLQQLNELQNLSSVYNTNASSSSSNLNFSNILESILKSGSDNSSTIGTGTASAANNTVSSASGLDSLTIQPEKLALMMQLMSMQSMTSSAASIGSVDDSSDSDSSIFNVSNNGDNMSQTLNYMMESMLQNDSSSDSNSQNLNNSNALDI